MRGTLSGQRLTVPPGRIVAVAAPRMAAKESVAGQYNAFQGAVLSKRLQCVLGTGRHESATRRRLSREKLIGAYEAHEEAAWQLCEKGRHKNGGLNPVGSTNGGAKGVPLMRQSTRKDSNCPMRTHYISGGGALPYTTGVVHPDISTPLCVVGNAVHGNRSEQASCVVTDLVAVAARPPLSFTQARDRAIVW